MKFNVLFYVILRIYLRVMHFCIKWLPPTPKLFHYTHGVDLFSTFYSCFSYLFVFLTKTLLILSNNVLFLLFFFSAVQPIKVPWGLELVSDKIFFLIDLYTLFSCRRLEHKINRCVCRIDISNCLGTNIVQSNVKIFFSQM